MIEQFVSSWICWAIVLLALVCYQQLWAEYFELSHEGQGDEDTSSRHCFCGVLISALPLLGLLGTIVGLLDCFAAMADHGADSELMSKGIADALLTTQVGLVCAIPGWLLQGYISSRRRNLMAQVRV